MLKRQVEEATGREDKDPGMRFYIYHSAFLKNLILRIIYEHDRVRDLIPPGNNLLLSVFFFFFPSLPFSQWYWGDTISLPHSTVIVMSYLLG